MSRSLILKSIGVWVAFIPVAIINGIMRNSWYQQYTGELLAHQISTISASILFILLAYIVLKNEIPQRKNKQLILIGIGWTTLTVLFEFGFGHYLIGHSWDILLADYNIFKGRIWSLFLLACLFTPILIKQVKPR